MSGVIGAYADQALRRWRKRRILRELACYGAYFTQERDAGERVECLCLPLGCDGGIEGAPRADHLLQELAGVEEQPVLVQIIEADGMTEYFIGPDAELRTRCRQHRQSLPMAPALTPKPCGAS